jgi:hypothetical protein
VSVETPEGTLMSRIVVDASTVLVGAPEPSVALTAIR